MNTSSPGTILTVSPHPDDEVLGLGATLTLLADQGWTLHNLACSLGREEDHVRRRRELDEAGRRMGFKTTVMEPLARISSSDDLAQAAREVGAAVIAMMETCGPAIVVSPHPTDGHHGHEAVAQGVRLALEKSTNGPRWWTYAIWNDLAKPNIYVPYDEVEMDRVMSSIEAYSGEVDRSRYDVMYSARAIVNRTLGSERVFGFGSATATTVHYADLITEVRHGVRGWEYAAPRMLDVKNPLHTSWVPGDVGWWLRQPTLREQWGRSA